MNNQGGADFWRILNKYVLGEVIVDDLPSVALDALDAGYDTPSLCQLAGAQGADPEELRGLLNKSLNELNVAMPTPPEAAFAKAQEIAREIINGAVDPYQGAKRIWWDVYNRFPELKSLLVFVGCASEIDDDPAHRDHYLRDIVEESKKLVGA